LVSLDDGRIVDGRLEGSLVEGFGEGCAVASTGRDEGFLEGLIDIGKIVDLEVGAPIGPLVGLFVGTLVIFEGANVGSAT
jgi:hypothetical protein